MNVLLINPPLEHLIKVGIGLPVEKRGFFPSLGILYIAAYSTQHTDHTIRVLDAPLEGIGFDTLEQIIREKKPDIVGISTLTHSLIDSLMTARIVKKISSRIPVVLGGIHVTLFPYETMSFEEVDYAVMGEGEITFAELLKNIGDNEKLKKVTGLLFKENGRIINTGHRPYIENLDDLPFPLRKLTPYQNYYSLRKKTLATSLFTNRGCPFNCLFCITARGGGKLRTRSAQNVVDEMKECIKMGITEFIIYDDIFTINRKRTLEICDRIIDQGLDIEWNTMTRVDMVDRELLRKMKKAGCTRIRYGVESGTEEILNVLRKKISLEQIREAFKMTSEEGISTVSYFMIGAPTETKEQINETIKLAQELNAGLTSFSIVTLNPGTRIYSLALEQGLLVRDCWREFAKDPSPDFQPPLWEEIFTRQELMQMQAYAYKKFYLRPSYIARKLFTVTSWKGFNELTRLGFKLIGSFTTSSD